MNPRHMVAPFDFTVIVPSFGGWRIVAGFVSESDARIYAVGLLAGYPSVKIKRTDDGETMTVSPAV